MALKVGISQSARAATAAVMPRRPADPARLSRALMRKKRAVMLVIMLAWAVRLPRERATQQHALMFVILLAAAGGFARDNQARVAAWDKRRNQRYLRSLKARGASGR